MREERRYGEKEVEAIFELAASNRGGSAGSGGHAVASTEGFSLAELQAIGAEAGIEPERVAHAAAALEQRGRPLPRRKMMGAPVGVSRTVDLPRAPTDGEWEQLVAELRHTFGAHGKDASQGSLRAWRNGNLHAYVEPTADGHRLRLGSLKGDAAGFASMGIIALVTGLIMALVMTVSEDAEEAVMGVVIALMGILALVVNRFRVGRWADEREQQMEYIASRARTLIRAPEPEPADPV